MQQKADEFRCCPKEIFTAEISAPQTHPELFLPEADGKAFLVYGFCQFMTGSSCQVPWFLHTPLAIGKCCWHCDLFGAAPGQDLPHCCSADLQNPPDQPLFVNGIPDAVLSALIEYIQALSVRVLYIKDIPYILSSSSPDLLVLFVLFLDQILAQSFMPTCSE